MANKLKIVAMNRYPKDIYDRIWSPYIEPYWNQISTSLTVSTNSFRLPQDALKTAATPVNASAPFIDFESPNSSSDKVYIYLHFAEVQVLRANETREFAISVNGEVIDDSYMPLYLQSETVQTPSPIICQDQECIIELSKSGKSTHPPLLNAIEGFAAVEFLQSESEENDGTLLNVIVLHVLYANSNILFKFMVVIAIKNIRAVYGVNKISWQGDPCVPTHFLWDGLNCSNTDKSIPPRITSL